MCTLTTLGGVRWDIININGRAAFQRSSHTIMWYPARESYIVLNMLAEVVFSHQSLDHCFKAVSPSIN